MKANIIKGSLVVILWCFYHSVNAQPGDGVERPSNVININLLGQGSHISFDYDRTIPLSSKTMISAKAGIGMFKEICLFGCSGAITFLTIPHHITLNFGNERKFFEVGLGGTYYVHESKKAELIYPVIGYRIQPTKNGNGFIRLFVHTPINRERAQFYDLFIPVGFNFGYAF